jgi:hypothetical protein
MPYGCTQSSDGLIGSRGVSKCALGAVKLGISHGPTRQKFDTGRDGEWRMSAMNSNWRHTSVGYYEFGGTVTIIDPIELNHFDAELTDVHEQCHRDLMNATIYGFVLNRLAEMKKKKLASEHNPEGVLNLLSSRMWRCAEGSATAIEVQTAHDNFSAELAQQLIQRLPPDYYLAWSVFRPIADKDLHWPTIPAVGVKILKHSLIMAAAELAADWGVFTLNHTPDDFWDLIKCFLGASPPDTAVKPIVATILKLSPRRHFRDLFNAGRGLVDFNEHFGIYVRALVKIAKERIIVTRTDVKRSHLNNDEERLVLIDDIDTKLTNEYPSLAKTIRFGKIMGGEVRIKPVKQKFMLLHETLRAKDLETRIQQLSAVKWFSHFIFEFYITKTGPEQRALYVKPIHLESSRADMGSPYLCCDAISIDDLHKLDSLPVRHIWQTLGVPLQPKGFLDAELVLSLTAPVFLHLETFSWERAHAILESPRGALTSRVFTLSEDHKLAVASLRDEGNISVFGLTITSFAGYAALGQFGNNKGVKPDKLLGSVVMNVYRSGGYEE